MNITIAKQESINGIVNTFFNAIANDARISPAHVSLYMALLHIWSSRFFTIPLYIYSNEIMPLAKICGTATYHRSIRELDKYGYIKYIPSHNYILGSLVYMLELKISE
jgi:hypothetical protein